MKGLKKFLSKVPPRAWLALCCVSSTLLGLVSVLRDDWEHDLMTWILGCLSGAIYVLVLELEDDD